MKPCESLSQQPSRQPSRQVDKRRRSVEGSPPTPGRSPTEPRKLSAANVRPVRSEHGPSPEGRCTASRCRKPACPLTPPRPSHKQARRPSHSSPARSARTSLGWRPSTSSCRLRLRRGVRGRARPHPRQSGAAPDRRLRQVAPTDDGWTHGRTAVKGRRRKNAGNKNGFDQPRSLHRLNTARPTASGTSCEAQPDPRSGPIRSALDQGSSEHGGRVRWPAVATRAEEAALLGHTSPRWRPRAHACPASPRDPVSAQSEIGAAGR